MIHYNKFTLANGLRVIVHEDHTTPMAVINVLYDVGARDENPAQTGFAHLFEHLMFGGSINIPSYDEPLQMAGGENNAYTTSDLTNYYIQLPAENIETGFWLESDRMLSLAFDEKSLDVQRKVVSEEFKEHYINKPYGDVWHKMRELSYTTHPYRWMTIGKELSHIENAKLEDVKAFFFKYYRPINAILSVGGNVTVDQVKALAEKWFGDIPSGEKYYRNLPVEPAQTAAHKLEVKANVPLDALYKCYHMYARTDKRYYAADLISDILGGGSSSRLNQVLVKEKKLFSNIECYHFGSLDAGLLTIEGKLVKGVKMKDAEKAIQQELEKLQQEVISERELQKVKNRVESLLAFEDMSLLNRANNLAFYELLGDAALMNREFENYEVVTAAEIHEEAKLLFDEKNSNTIYYYAAN
ncbi:Predicted Zn-dependent peptidase [Chitinophaga ginsengisegetis]|uniref:Predicted Zn-dependent peptidase n=1 Tax=Chitinophaga ginsengisegetis TaxID=393003 RepID=A0A1T5P7D2_9BACT|nr:pitrilysin family protein [Chitinophaga ginsengisegetis]MDR6566162.1 putative Zn-dependent peptidase [Chitinophaga ginsengisegetis]MDR6645892.1 putative Zn-dependent peptidase [Chitinophaga ginsengisegetis]MDR6651516.1 putative Zn-dependent peptidase [Chitinophaga ginsengisegetis]SKD08298.1 Predicted Zn-dependent peptidase [Chitinophaga ginsengisegetis]